MAEHHEIRGLLKEQEIESMITKIVTMHVIQYRNYNNEKRISVIKKRLFVQTVLSFSGANL
jgi:hypothetical protein